MNASDLKATADAVNNAIHRAKECSFEILITKAEVCAKLGEYNTMINHFNDELKKELTWVSDETKQKFVDRGFWFSKETYSGYTGGGSVYYYLHWDKKPWWRFWS